VWGKCEKPNSGKNLKNSRGKTLEKNVEKIGVEKMWINDLEEVKSLEKNVKIFHGKILHI